MEMFGNILHEILINKDYYSISAFAKDIGISAGLLNHIFNGKRTLAPDKFLMTLKNSCFDCQETEKLKRAYFCDRYGEVHYEKIKLLHEMLQSAEFNNNFSLDEIESICFDGTVVLEGKNRIIWAIAEFFKGADREVYTNVPYSADKINSALFALKRGNKSAELFRFSSRLSGDFSKESFMALLSVIRFAQIGVPAVYSDNDVGFNVGGAAVFPYYIISEKMLLLTDEKYDTAIFICGEDFISEKYGSIKRKYTSCKKAVSFFDSEMEMTSYLLTHESEESYTLEFTPGFFSHDDLSCLMSALPAELAFKDEVIMFLANRTTSKKWSIYTSLEGLNEFLKTGRSYVTSLNYLGVFSLEAKIKFLDSLLHTIQSSKVYSHNYFNLEHRFSDFVKGLHFQLDDSNLTVYSMRLPESGDSFVGQIFMPVENNDTYRVISSYIKDYLPICGEIISSSAAVNNVSGLLLECKRQGTQGKK